MKIGKTKIDWEGVLAVIAFVFMVLVIRWHYLHEMSECWCC